MTDEDRSFNYNDLNLDFLQLSPPRAKPVVKQATIPIPNNASFRPSAFKATQLAQRVAQNDVLVNKIEYLKKENSELQQKLKDFQKSATQIQNIYENEKKICNDVQGKLKAAENKSYEVETLCGQLKNDVAEKRLQLEQLEAQLEEGKGPLSYIELAIKFLKLVQKVNEEDTLKVVALHEKSLYLGLSKYCENRGFKIPIVINRKKRVYKKDREVQCELLESINIPIPKKTQTQSTQTAIIQLNHIQTQTTGSLGKDMHTQTQQLETYFAKSLQEKAVQTIKTELRTQSTQHISTTTTRGTSTTCFIKKHNVSTCFPEPTFGPPVTAMVDELLQFYNVSPLSPISDPITLTSHDEVEAPITPAVAHLPPSYKSIGTCTYLCNVQRQIDFIPPVANIKRSQSDSPAPFTCDSVKFEAYATPTPSPPPPLIPTSPAVSHIRNETTMGAAGSDNLSNMQPMLSAFAQLPDMQPEVFSTIWQMAGQMFMGLMYPPTNNRMRIAHFNQSQNSLNQEQFHNWITSLYESMQQPVQQLVQQPTSTPLPHTECQQHDCENGSRFDVETEDNTNTLEANNAARREGKKKINIDDSTNEMIDLQRRAAFGADESTQTDNIISSADTTKSDSEKNSVEWIFKEPNEIPKKSAKQARARKSAGEEATYMKKQRGKRSRKPRRHDKGEKLSKVAKLSTTSLANGELLANSVKETSTPSQEQQDFATAVEFCANLYNFNGDAAVEFDRYEEVDDVNSAANANQSNAPAEQDEDCEEFACVGNLDAEKRNNREVSASDCCEKDDNNFEFELDKNILKEKVEVPDDTLSDSENSNCDSFDFIEAIIEAGAQQESSAKQMKQNFSTAYSIFGVDSDDEFGIISNDYKYNRYVEASRDTRTILDEGESTLKNKETPKVPEKRDILDKDTGDPIDARVDCYNNNNNNSSSNNLRESLPKLEKNESSLQSTASVKVKPNTSPDHVEPEISTSCFPQILDLAMSDTESEENESDAPTSPMNTSVRHSSETFSESDELNDSKLVIVEDVTDEINKNRTVSESSIESNPSNDYVAMSGDSPKKDPLEVSDSYSDISVLLENEIVDDLLANASTQKLFNSILRETANEVNEPAVNTPRRRGRKRKREMHAITFCKHSERLRAKKSENAQIGSDDDLTTSSKCELKGIESEILPDGVDTSKAHTASKPLSRSLTKQQMEKQFQRFLEIKQRVDESDMDNKSITEAPDYNSDKQGSTNDFCENTADVDGVETACQLHQLSTRTCAKFSKDITACCATNSSRSSSLEIEPVYSPPINQKDYDRPLSPPIQSIVNTSPEANESDSVFCASNASSSNSYPATESDAQLIAHSHTEFDTPASPPATSNVDFTFANSQRCREIPLELDSTCYPKAQSNLFRHLINNYSADIYATVTGVKNQLKIQTKFTVQLENFLNNTRDKMDVLASTLAASWHEDFEDDAVIANLVIEQISKAPRPETELNCELANVPRKYLGTHLRLISIFLRHLHYKRPEIYAVILAKIENRLFNYQHSETVSSSMALNLTQLYLLVIPLQNSQLNPARLFLAKCLYYYNVLSYPMIYEVLCWYPTTLPHRDEPDYDRSDALITVIQHLLMCTTYNMDSKDLRHKELLSLLRFEYHFVPFQPKALEVLCNLVAKLKTGHLTHLKYAFAIFCKRQTKLVDILLKQQLLPLADEYYKLVQRSNDYDERIAALLECISAVVKPLSLDTDVTLYFSIFERFLGAVQRPVVQEAAVLAILRMQRFGYNRCFHALVHFKPHYPLQMLTINALKTFIHKKPLIYWKRLLKQAITAN